MTTPTTRTDPARVEGDGLPAVALAVPAVAWSAGLASLVLAWINRPEWTPDQWYFVVDVTDAVIYGLVSWLLLRRVRTTVALLIALTAVGGGRAALGAQWFQYSLTHPDAPTLKLLSSMQSLAWVPGTLGLVMIVPWLVRDDRLGRGGRAAVALGAAVIAWFMLFRLTDPFPWPEAEPTAPLPIRDQGWADLVDRSGQWQMAAVCLLGFVAAGDALRRWSTRTPEQRRGLGWLAIGTFAITLSFLPLALPVSWTDALPAAFTPVLHLTSQAFFPGAILVVVLGQRLWGLDLAVSRTLVWSLLTFVLSAAYVGVVSLLGALAPGREGFQQIFATAFVAAGFQPVKVWVQRRVNHLVHGDAAEPLRAVRRVGRRLEGPTSEGSLLQDVVGVVGTSMRLDAVAIVVDGPVGARVLVGTPPVAGATSVLEVPLVVRERDVGRLVASPRPGERLDGRTISSVEELAPLVAAAVELTTATEALSESRSRLAAARDEERRALRRELHDQLGPALAGIGLTLRAAGNLLATDPTAAVALLERAAGEVDQRVEEVRSMARGLLPPVLEELGLLPALADLVETHRGVLPMTLDCDAALDLPPRVAGEIYAIVSEAVRNVVRHAEAGCCTVAVHRIGAEVTVEVRDDGVGLDPAAPPGVGLRSMRERAESLGGRLTVRGRDEGGTVVQAVLPLAKEAT